MHLIFERVVLSLAVKQAGCLLFFLSRWLIYLLCIVFCHEELKELVDHTTWVVPCVLSDALMISSWLLMCLRVIGHQWSIYLLQLWCRRHCLHFVIVIIGSSGWYLVAVFTIVEVMRFAQDLVALSFGLLSCFVYDIWWPCLLRVLVVKCLWVQHTTDIRAVSCSVRLPADPRGAYFAWTSVVAIDANALPNLRGRYSSSADLYAHALSHLMLSNERLVQLSTATALSILLKALIVFSHSTSSSVNRASLHVKMRTDLLAAGDCATVSMIVFVFGLITLKSCAWSVINVFSRCMATSLHSREERIRSAIRIEEGLRAFLLLTQSWSSRWNDHSMRVIRVSVT